MLKKRSLRDALYERRLPTGKLRLLKKLTFETIKRRNEIEYRLKYVGVRKSLFYNAVAYTARVLGIIERGPRKVEEALRLELEEIASGELLESLKYRHPIRMIKLFKRILGDEAYELMNANNTPSPIRFRVNRLKADEGVLKRLKSKGIEFEEDEEFPGVYKTRDRRIFETEERKKRLIITQDKSSQSVLTLFSGGFVVDACAAPGTKTQGLAERCDDVIAIDMDAKRVRRMRRLLELYNARVHIIAADSMYLHKLFSRRFDGVLVDAPCSNLGSIRDMPEIKRLMKPSKPRVLSKVQKAILRSAVRISDYVVYSTCTVTRIENEEVVKEIADEEGLEVITPFKNRRGFGIGSRFRPHKDDTHGFFVAILRRS